MSCSLNSGVPPADNNGRHCFCHTMMANDGTTIVFLSNYNVIELKAYTDALLRITIPTALL